MVLINSTISSILDFAILISALIAVVLAFGIMQRSERRLHFAFRFLFLAMLVFALVKIVDIFTELFFISIAPFEKVIELMFALLIMVAFWGMHKCIKSIDGKLIGDSKLRIIRK